MDTTIARGRPSAGAVFEDGLGKRYEQAGSNGDPMSVLVLSQPLINTPGLEAKLREQQARLGVFHHPSFARVHRVARVMNSEKGLAIASEHIRGHRLSALLTAADSRSMPLDLKASWTILSQLVSAIALLHERVPGFYHGAIAPERIVITPEGRVVVVEHILGSTLSQLHWMRQQYWRTLRVAVPEGADPVTFDERVDVAQIGAVALALLLGHPLGADYPSRVGGRLEGASPNMSAEAALELLPDGIRTWMSRALQLDRHNSFASAIEARSALDLALDDTDYIGAPEALASFLRSYEDGLMLTPEPVLVDAPTEIPPPAAVPSIVATGPKPSVSTAAPPVSDPWPARAADHVNEAPRPLAIVPAPMEARVEPAPIAEPKVVTGFKPVEEPKRVQPAAAIAPVVTPAPVTSTPIAAVPVVAVPAMSQPIAAGEPTTAKVESPKPKVESPFATISEIKIGASHKTETRPKFDAVEEFHTEDSLAQGDWKSQLLRWRIAAAVAAVVIAGSATTFAARQYFKNAAVSLAATGTLSLVTDPAGAIVSINGVQRGTTPLRLELEAGDHTIELLNANGRRTLPVSLTAGAQLSQVVEMPRGTATTAATEGQLQIRTEPSGAKVVVDGQPRGTSPVTITGLSAGMHNVTLTSDHGTITEQVNVPAGAMASLVVPLGNPNGAPLSGWLAINAPAELQIFEGGRLIGSTRSERIMAAAGRHEIELVNEAIGYRATRTITVTAGQTTTVSPDWPNGTVALNAVPWADVWLDGQRVGETPIGSIPVPIGRHEFIFRHPQHGEQRQSATVTANTPLRLSIDMTKRQP